VANVRELRAISHSDRKSDQVDAEKLARYARLDPNILRPISHRTVEQQEALTLIRARDLLVRLRTAAVNAVRGLTKACGHRMPASSTRCFAQRSLAVMPPGLQQALGPVLEQIAEMTAKIKYYDCQIQQMTQTEYPLCPLASLLRFLRVFRDRPRQRHSAVWCLPDSARLCAIQLQRPAQLSGNDTCQVRALSRVDRD
jgi:transposase